MNRTEKRSLLARYELKRREEKDIEIEKLIEQRENNLSELEQELSSKLMDKGMGGKIYQLELEDYSDLPASLSDLERWFLGKLRDKFGFSIIFS